MAKILDGRHWDTLATAETYRAIEWAKIHVTDKDRLDAYEKGFKDGFLKALMMLEEINIITRKW